METTKKFFQWLNDKSFCEKLSLGLISVYLLGETGILPEKFIHNQLSINSLKFKKNSLIAFLASPFIVKDVGYLIKELLHLKVIDGIVKNNNLGLRESGERKLFIFYTGHYLGLLALKTVNSETDIGILGPTFGLYSLLEYYSFQKSVRTDEGILTGHMPVVLLVSFEIMFSDFSFTRFSARSLKNFDNMVGLIYPIFTSVLSGLLWNFIS